MNKVCLTAFVILLFLTSCGESNPTPSSIAKEQATIILNSFKTGEKEELKKLFCEKIASSHDLDFEIEEAMDCIEGEIIDDGKWIGMSESGKSVNEGVVTKSDINASMVDVTTSTGKKYIISFLTYLTYNDSQQNVGMTYIIVKNEDGVVLYMIGEILH